MNTIHMYGEINLKTSPRVRDKILGNLHQNDGLNIDLSDVTVIDSSGLAILVEAAAKARKIGLRIHFTHISDACLKMIRLAHLEGILLDGNLSRVHAVH